VTTVLRSDEIMCGGCTATIEKALSALPGVSVVSGDAETKLVTVEHDDSVSVEELIEKMDEAGFEASRA
jgi:Cu+-exporting ATPase